MQLVAYGAQDIYLSGNPQITFFKVVYRRHTNFAMESIGQIFNATTDFGKKVSCIVPRNGDLVYKMYLEIKLPALKQSQGTNTYVEWVPGIGNALIRSISVHIGGQMVDKHYGEWLDIWGELTMDGNRRDGYNDMVGNRPVLTRAAATSNARHPRTLYVPLGFWFNKNPGLALPLIALQYHEVEIKVEFEELDKLCQSGPSSGEHIGQPLAKDGTAAKMLSCRLFIDYIYLDTDERRRFAQVSHEYLIEQLQYTGVSSLSAGQASERVNLNFNHPVKSMHWVIQPTGYLEANSLESIQVAPAFVDPNNPTTSELQSSDDSGKNWGGNQKTTFNVKKSTDGKNDTFSTAKIMLNGHDRMSERDADYYRIVQNCQHMPNYPSKTIYTYSFCLNPAEHQPSGACNFSRIDNAVMPLTFSPNQCEEERVIKVFAINYNVLRVMSGMGGLAYSN